MAEAEAADRAEGVADAADAEARALKKPVAAVLEGGDLAGGSRGPRARPFALSLQLADLLAPPTAGLPALLEGGAASPPSAQLSPAGLISIAAADIDEAGSSPRPGAPRDLDWEFIAALRRRAEGGPDADRRPSTGRRCVPRVSGRKDRVWR